MKKTLFALALAAIAWAGQAEERTLTPQQALGFLVQNGQYDQARKLIKALGGNEFDQLFLEVQIAEREGRIDDAIESYRKILQLRPELSVLRLNLANLLVINKQYDSARFHYGVLRDGAQDDQTRTVLAKRISEIAKFQPYGFGFQFELTPSDNINGAGADKTVYNFGGMKFEVENPDELKPQFGWRASLGASAYYRSRIADQQQMIMRLNTNAAFHTYDTIDYQFASLSTNYQYQNARTTVELGPFVQRYWGDGEYYVSNQTQNRADKEYRDEDYTSYGYSLSAQHLLNAKNKIGASFRHSNRYFDGDDQKYRNGYSNQIGLWHQHAFSARDSFSWDLGWERYVEASIQKDYKSANSYIGKSIGVSWGHGYENGVHTDFGLDYKLREYDENYGGKDFPREDKVYGMNLSLQNNNWQIGKFVPRMNCRYEKTDSNVESFQISGANCGITLSTEF